MAQVVTRKPTDREKSEAWKLKWLGQYTESELASIDRFWTSLCKKIMNGARIPDKKLGRPVKKR
jgi:hypothetical protein